MWLPERVAWLRASSIIPGFSLVTVLFTFFYAYGKLTANQNQQDKTPVLWFSGFCWSGKPVTTADLLWSDHGCSFPLKSSSCGHVITKLETVRSNFSWTIVTMVSDRTCSAVVLGESDRAISFSLSPKCRAFSRVVMDKKPLSTLFPAVGDEAVVTKYDWCTSLPIVLVYMLTALNIESIHL